MLHKTVGESYYKEVMHKCKVQDLAIIASMPFVTSEAIVEDQPDVRNKLLRMTNE